MSAFEFMGAHPFLTFSLALLAYGLATMPLRLVNRWIRHKNIAARGWPPYPNMDADGDVHTDAVGTTDPTT